MIDLIIDIQIPIKETEFYETYVTLLPFVHVSAVPQYSNFSGPILPTSHGARL